MVHLVCREDVLHLGRIRASSVVAYGLKWKSYGMFYEIIRYVFYYHTV